MIFHFALLDFLDPADGDRCLLRNVDTPIYTASYAERLEYSLKRL